MSRMVKTVKVESPGELKIQEPWARGCFCPFQLRSSTLEVCLSVNGSFVNNVTFFPVGATASLLLLTMKG